MSPQCHVVLQRQAYARPVRKAMDHLGVAATAAGRGTLANACQGVLRPSSRIPHNRPRQLRQSPYTTQLTLWLQRLTRGERSFVISRLGEKLRQNKGRRMKTSSGCGSTLVLFHPPRYSFASSSPFAVCA